MKVLNGHVLTMKGNMARRKTRQRDDYQDGQQRHKVSHDRSVRLTFRGYLYLMKRLSSLLVLMMISFALLDKGYAEGVVEGAIAHYFRTAGGSR